MAADDTKKEPSTPYGEGGEPTSKPKNPATGEPSAPYGESGSDPSGQADRKQDPSQQPT